MALLQGGTLEVPSHILDAPEVGELTVWLAFASQPVDAPTVERFRALACGAPPTDPGSGSATSRASAR